MESRGEKIKRLRATDPFDNRMGFQIIRLKQDQTDKKTIVVSQTVGLI